MAFVTQHKAEAWVEVIERKEETEILKNRTNYPPHVVPETAVALTAGIDVQKVRILVRGPGLGAGSFLPSHRLRVLAGLSPGGNPGF